MPLSTIPHEPALERDELIAFGEIPGTRFVNRFGYVSDVDTATDPEDVWPGGGDYTGHDGTANEEIRVLSDNAADAGTVRSSGTATGGSLTTLIDSGATFVTDSVAVGDVVLNDTNLTYGFVSSIDSETQLTVITPMHEPEASNDTVPNASGDTYRVVGPASTGATVVYCSEILDSTWDTQNSVFIVLNGTTPVTTSGVNAFRCTRQRIVAAGTGEANIGTITCTQGTTTANVFGVILPDYSQTTQAVGSVPLNKRVLIKSIRLTTARTGGAAAECVLALRARVYKGVWRNINVWKLQTGAIEDIDIHGGIILDDHVDFKIRVLEVSGNDFAVSANIEYKEITDD